MQIMLCGSMSFARKMMEVKNKLEELGHTVFLPCDIEVHLKDPTFIDNLKANYHHAVEKNVIKHCFNLITECDAILVLNYPKNNVPGYVGASSLMEIGLAHHLDKKIFLLNQIPESSQFRWAHEVSIIGPQIIQGDLNKIK